MRSATLRRYGRTFIATGFVGRNPWRFAVQGTAHLLPRCLALGAYFGRQDYDEGQRHLVVWLPGLTVEAEAQRLRFERHCPDCPCRPTPGEVFCWRCGAGICDGPSDCAEHHPAHNDSSRELR